MSATREVKPRSRCWRGGCGCRVTVHPRKWTAGVRLWIDTAAGLSQIQPQPLSQYERDNLNGWRDGRLSFEGQPFSEVIRGAQPVNRQQLVVGDPGNAGLPIDGVFLATDVDSFIAFLRKTLEIQVQLGGRGSVRDPHAYLFKAALNVLSDANKKAQADRERIISCDPQMLERYAQEQGLESCGPDSSAAMNDSTELGRAFRRLPRTAQEAWAHKRDGLSYKEIARKMNVTDHTVKKYISTALQGMRAYLTRQHSSKYRRSPNNAASQKARVKGGGLPTRPPSG
jgi:DNA-directed RNA polymerase specialized sigma24 family protein